MSGEPRCTARGCQCEGRLPLMHAPQSFPTQPSASQPDGLTVTVHPWTCGAVMHDEASNPAHWLCIRAAAAVRAHLAQAAPEPAQLTGTERPSPVDAASVSAPESDASESYTVEQISRAYAKHAGPDDWDIPSFYENGLIAALRGEYDRPAELTEPEDGAP